MEGTAILIAVPFLRELTSDITGNWEEKFICIKSLDIEGHLDDVHWNASSS